MTGSSLTAEGTGRRPGRSRAAVRRGAGRIVEGSDLRFGLVTFALVLALSALFAVSTPIGSSPDEHVQIVRAASVARGDLGGAMTETPSPGPGQANQLDYVVTIPRSYAEVLHQPCYAFKPDVTATCSPVLDDDATPTQATTYVGSYPPPYYFVVGLPSLVLPAGSGVYAMRLVSALLVAALFAVGFVTARRLGGGVLVAAAAVLVTPVALYLGGTVNPSGVEIAAAFAAWLTALDLLRRRTGSRTGTEAESGASEPIPVWRFTVAAATLVVTRPSGLLVAAVIAVTVLVAVGSPQGIASLWRRRPVRLAAAILVGVVALTGAWILHADAIGTFLGIPMPEVTRAEAVRHILTDNVNLLRQMIGVFGWLDVTIPDPVWMLWGATALVLVVVGFVVADLRRKLAMVVALAIGVFAPPLTQLRDVARYGYIWSGRYSLPFAMGLVVLAGWAISRRFPRDHHARAAEDDAAEGEAIEDQAEGAGGADRDRAARVERGVVAAGAVLIGSIATTGLAVSYVVVMQRFTTGVGSGRFDYLHHAEWHPPLNPVATSAAFALVAVAWGAWIALNGALVRRRNPGPPP